ncbi:MAG: Smr/MutS family protein [Rikenellaceae bacterium]|nr:Smr/MutS family protein [Rikenellaceae bacterium]
MIYPKELEIKIGFDRIRSQIDKLCATKRGKEILSDTGFSSSFKEVRQRILLTDEMRTVLMMECDFPQNGYVDLAFLRRKLEIEGAFLDTDELAVLKTGLSTVVDISRFFSSKEEENYPHLKQLTSGVATLPHVISEIDSIIDRFGKVKDNASPELQNIRRSIADKEGQVSRRLNQIMREGQASGIIDPDVSISIREGRAVIPVSAANKRRFKGFVHDESATGKTFYIEPIEIVELNNELKELEYSERREIVKILTNFTDRIRPYTEDIAGSGEFLAIIDFIRAKGRFSLENNCVKPVMTLGPLVRFIKARHVLLEQTLRSEGKTIVPLDITLTPDKHILVISGPNAGGKSVCLKTVGLLQYMLQCGLPIPASENSETGIFKSIFIDIGDEQSIDNDLSTYSSHLLNMKQIVKYSDDRSLVLIDEFGSGTEPVIGGAIAEAVLEELEKKRTFGVITTHYSNLKYYASNAQGIRNGAMSFDVQNIMPLFKLETGKPGSSFAIEIARKIGLPEDIIRNASEKAGTDRINLEKNLREIARDKHYWEAKRDKIRIAEKRTDELAAKYEKELSELKEERKKLLKEAKEEASRVIAEANRRIESTIREIRESQADKERTKKVRKELEEFKETFSHTSDNDRIETKMRQLQERERRRGERKKNKTVDTGDDTTPKLVEKRDLTAGDKVAIKGQSAVGEIISIASGKAVVAFGQIMTTISADKLELISNSQYKKSMRESASVSSYSSYDTSKRRLNFKQQLDVRGERAVDAVSAVREFVDEAIMLGIPDIKILHGKGTGALKQEIRNYLSTVDLVERYGDEDEKFGGAGITVVKLDL